MDKQDKFRTITIKLNGNEQNYHETKQPSEPQIKRHIEEKSFEESGFSQIAAADDLADESFDWILPEITDNEIEEYKKIKTVINDKKIKQGKSKLTPGGNSKRIMKSVFFAVVFAILLGTSFGILMLKLVTSYHTGEVPGKDLEAVSQPVRQVEDGHTTAYTIPPLTTYIVQEGVYSSKQFAMGAAALAEEKGASTQVVEMNGKAYFLFLGSADSLDHAKKLGGNYQVQGFKVYAKPFTIAEKKIKKVSEEEKTFFEKAAVLFLGLSGFSSTALMENSLSNDLVSNFTDIQKDIKSVEELNIKNEKISQLRKELVKASEEMKDYQKNGDIKLAKAAQQSLLNYLSLYNSL